MHGMDKIGSFDWIADWPELKQYVEQWHAECGVGQQQEGEGLRVLVAGCGTSPLSFNLAELGIFREVVSVDNDAECVTHMQRQTALRNQSSFWQSELRWHVYDMVERCVPASSSAVMVTASQLALRDESFDLIVDKGTLDAILVGGAAFPMFCEVHRMLKANGCYLLCSIHTQELLHPLFSTPVLRFDVIRMDGVISPGSSIGGDEQQRMGTMMLCRKPCSAALHMHIIDEEALALHERQVMDFYYKEEQPLLTEEYLERLQSGFAFELQQLKSQHQMTNPTWTSEYLPFDAVHRVLFSRDEALGYTYTMFLSDLASSSFPRAVDGQLSLQEMLEFVREMQ